MNPYDPARLPLHLRLVPQFLVQFAESAFDFGPAAFVSQRRRPQFHCCSTRVVASGLGQDVHVRVSGTPAGKCRGQRDGGDVVGEFVDGHYAVGITSA